jgi:RNA polymerase sigma factor (sigma-70 family)
MRQAIDAIYRIEFARLVAGVTRLVRDVGLAEDLAQDALVAALEQWPRSGVPENPGAWLMAAAKRKAIDRVRRDRLHDRKRAEIAEARRRTEEDLDAMLDDDIGDDLLRLVFMTCHPALPVESRVALTLRLVGGLTTAEIARGLLAAEPAIAQRIVRAKRTLQAAGVPFEVPRGKDLDGRLPAVLGVLYLIFNEGYTATAGEDWVRPALCLEALRLGRVLAGLMPEEPEVLGLVALMEIQASRLKARTGKKVVRLFEQDRALWDRILIRRGLDALGRAAAAGGPRGPYLLQAEIAACHARARAPEETDWPRIVALYEELAAVAPSPVVELNRAVAVSFASGPAAGLALLDALEGELRGYHLLFAVRGDLLEKLGRLAEARAEFERAAALAANAAERGLLLDRARACGSAK